jgi:hypothetical protein
VSPEYGVKLEAPVVSVVAAGAPDATFTTLVVPLAAGEAAPGLELGSDRDVTVARVVGERVTDTVSWCDTEQPLDLGPLQCRASAGWMRADADGAVRVRTAGVGGGPVWAGWDRRRGMSAGREGHL